MAMSIKIGPLIPALCVSGAALASPARQADPCVVLSERPEGSTLNRWGFAATQDGETMVMKLDPMWEPGGGLAVFTREPGHPLPRIAAVLGSFGGPDFNSDGPFDVDGDWIVAGPQLGGNAEFVLLMRRVNGQWGYWGGVFPPSNHPTARFGVGAAVGGDRLVVGDPRFPGLGHQVFAGQVFVFDWDGNDWILNARIEGPVQGPFSAHFGRGVSVAGDRVAIEFEDPTSGRDLVALYAQSAPGTWSLEAEFPSSGPVHLRDEGLLVTELGVPGVGDDLVLYDLDDASGIWGEGARTRIGYNVRQLDFDGTRVAVPAPSGSSPMGPSILRREGATFALEAALPRTSLNNIFSPWDWTLLWEGGAIVSGGSRLGHYRIGCSVAGETYCSQATPNSTGRPALLYGEHFQTTSEVRLWVQALPPQSFAMAVASPVEGLTMTPGLSQGIFCLGGPMGRFDDPSEILFSDGSGVAVLDVDLSALPTSFGTTAAQAGETWHFQVWHRDVLSVGITSNFSNGWRIEL